MQADARRTSAVPIAAACELRFQKLAGGWPIPSRLPGSVRVISKHTVTGSILGFRDKMASHCAEEGQNRPVARSSTGDHWLSRRGMLVCTFDRGGHMQPGQFIHGPVHPASPREVGIQNLLRGSHALPYCQTPGGTCKLGSRQRSKGRPTFAAQSWWVCR